MHWGTCDGDACEALSEDQMNPPKMDLPRTVGTPHGEDSFDLFGRVLRLAWGESPPSVDLFVRGGCHGKMEMDILWESLLYFWPRHLGKIVFVVDVHDRA
jgi:hypothetical protein